MWLRLLLSVILVSQSLCWPEPNPKATKNVDKPIITTPLGKIQGSIIASKTARQIFSFRGIRYAKAPINELRFKPPVPEEKWEGIYNATEDGPLCPQQTSDPTSEDCLFLNVYSPKLVSDADKTKLPVIVYIHGGGWYSLGGASYWIGPQYLLDHDIVLVTINYRLGTLGFLSTGDKEALGNNGLKDQVQALKWVQENIESFAGDPDQVTLAGSSVGAASVTLHLVSPMSKGLFHRAICMSGSALGQWPIHNNQLDLAKKQARIVGCPDDTATNIIKCLRGKSANELAESLPQFREFGDDPIIIWSPVLEEDHGQERFLTQHPIHLVSHGSFAKVPVIFGITTEEFAARAFNVISNNTLKEQINKEFEKVAPIAFIYDRDTESSKSISQNLKAFYFNNKAIDNSTLSGLAQLYADGIIGFGVNRGVRLFAEHNNESVYYYRFNYNGRYSHFYLPNSNGTIPYGVVHHDDSLYLFYNQKFPFFKDTDLETPTVNKMTSLWANFAKTGNPTPETNEKLDNIKWEPYNLKTQKYLDIGNKLVINDKLYEKRYAEWEKLFPVGQYSKNKKSHG